MLLLVVMLKGLPTPGRCSPHSLSPGLGSVKHIVAGLMDQSGLDSAYLAQLLSSAMQAAAKVARRQKQRKQTEPMDPMDEPNGTAAASFREDKPVRQKRAHPLDPFDGDVEMEPAQESKGQRRKRIKRMKEGAPMEVEEDDQAQPREDAEVSH